EAALANRTGSDPPAQGRIAVVVHRPDLRSPVGGGCRELDIPVGTIDRFIRSVRDVQRAEPEVIAAFVGDDDGTPIGEPARRKVRAVLCVAGDLASLAVARVDDEKVLGRVIEHPHHEEPRTVRRPATDDMPERTRHKWPYS